MRHGVFAILLALPACVSQAADSAMSADVVPCTLEGADLACATPEDVCALFTSAMADAGLGDVARIAVTTKSRTSAHAIAWGRDGEVLAQLDFDVVDREIGPTIWRNFARAFARHIASMKPAS